MSLDYGGDRDPRTRIPHHDRTLADARRRELAMLDTCLDLERQVMGEWRRTRFRLARQVLEEHRGHRGEGAA